MKKIILLAVICAFALCGCNANNTNTTTTSGTEQNYSNNNSGQNSAETSNETAVVGLWKHTVYPDAYSIKINSLDGRIMNLTIEAVRGNYSQIATAQIDDAYFKGGRTKFNFVDSFGNSGLCDIVINNEEMTVTYKTNTPYQGNWCIDAGEGTYKKAEAISGTAGGEKNNISDSGDSDSNTVEETPLSARNFFDSGKYVKVVGYGYDGDVYDGDIYDKDIYYEFDIPEAGEFLYNNYNDNSYGKDSFGTYKVLTSDKSDYGFKLIFDYADGHQQVFYVKTVIDRTVFDFYSEDGTPYIRLENYDNYALRRTNPDGKTYRMRYGCEYKQYQKEFNITALDGPFKNIS